MNTASIVVLGGVFCLIGLAAWYLVKCKNRGCCGNCAGCPMECKKD